MNIFAIYLLCIIVLLLPLFLYKIILMKLNTNILTKFKNFIKVCCSYYFKVCVVIVVAVVVAFMLNINAKQSISVFLLNILLRCLLHLHIHPYICRYIVNYLYVFTVLCNCICMPVI